MSVLEEFFVNKTDLFEYQECLELYLMANGINHVTVLLEHFLGAAKGDAF